MKQLLKVLLLPLLFLASCATEEEKLLKQGDEKFFAGDYSGAEIIYEQLKSLKSDSVVAYTRIANCVLAKTKDAKQFIRKLQETKNSSGNYESVLFRGLEDKDALGGRLLSIKERNEKLLKASNDVEFLNEAISKNPNKSELYLARGIWHFIIGENELCENDFNKALEISQNAKEVKLAIANCYLSYMQLNRSTRAPAAIDKKYFTALMAYQDLLEAGNAEPEIVLEAAMAYSLLGMRETAAKITEEALVKHPDNLKLMNSVAASARVTGDYPKAIKYFKILIEKEPNNNLHLESLAFVYLEMGNKSEGLFYLKKALELVKGTPDLKENLEKIIKRNS